MQPAAHSGGGAGGVKLVKGEVTGHGTTPVNEESWWTKKAEDDEIVDGVADKAASEEDLELRNIKSLLRPRDTRPSVSIPTGACTRSTARSSLR